MVSTLKIYFHPDDASTLNVIAAAMRHMGSETQVSKAPAPMDAMVMNIEDPDAMTGAFVAGLLRSRGMRVRQIDESQVPKQ